MNILLRYKSNNQAVIFSSFVAILLVCNIGCIKDVEYTSENEGPIYMAQAYENRAALTLYSIDSLQDINFGASYGGLLTPSSDIQMSFETDESLIDTYNEQNGTDFIPFPESSYSISALSTVIRAGRSDSDPLQISVSASGLQLGQPYMIPVRMVSASTGALDTSLSVAYFRIDSLVRRERDATGQGTLTVSHENTGGSSASEGSPKLVDNDESTKFLTQNYTSGMWFKLTFSSPIVLGAYTFTSGNDAESRDPKTWRLEGSNDDSNWTTLDTRTDETFSSRTLTRRFEFDNSEAFTRYRVVVVANNGATIFQMSEWRVIEFY